MSFRERIVPQGAAVNLNITIVNSGNLHINIVIGNGVPITVRPNVTNSGNVHIDTQQPRNLDERELRRMIEREFDDWRDLR